MLVAVGIEPDACRELAGTKYRAGRLARQLREQCLLATGATNLHELRDAVAESGSAELKLVIQQMLQHRRADDSEDGGAVPFDDLVSAADLASWRGIAELLLLSHTRVELLDEEDCEDEPEYATFATAMNSDALGSVDVRWRRRAAKGEKRNTIWAEVFQPLADRSEHVYVIDAYAAKSLYRALAEDEGARRRNGAVWFLQKLAGCKVRHVHVASSAYELGHVPAETAHAAITGWFAKVAPQTRLDLKLVSGEFFHERRVSFEGWAGFEPHKGLDSFTGVELREGMALDASYARATEVRRDYAALRANL